MSSENEKQVEEAIKNLINLKSEALTSKEELVEAQEKLEELQDQLEVEEEKLQDIREAYDAKLTFINAPSGKEPANSNTSSSKKKSSGNKKASSAASTLNQSSLTSFTTIDDEATALAAGIPCFIPTSEASIFTTTATGDTILADGSAISQNVIILVSTSIVAGNGALIDVNGQILGYVQEGTLVMTADAEVFEYRAANNRIIPGSRMLLETGISELQIESLTAMVLEGENLVISFIYE